ncbi:MULTISPECIES: flagellar biosynthetic protein FliR [Metabacillus]|uniref:Flagellar biosynthetic protein FliR n=1 Tax=Metabacillus indicus TaxID=246786 RepID=A0A084H3V2_METID|nr:MULTISPECIES: flagellar biosynthetic protein FliR [Metabacillus]KEZ54264.1 flagellar biosynthesis protein FliR [Metabacillus indicus]
MNVIEYIPAFLLIFARMSAFFVTMPLFSYRTIPQQHKIGFSFFLSVIVFSSVQPEPVEIGGEFVLLVLKEVIIGLMIGFSAYLMLAAVQIAGSLIDFQTGFAIANIIDPQTGSQSPLIGQFLNVLALLFMLSINAHHLLLDGVFYSYQFIPLRGELFPLGDGSAALLITKAFSAMFLIAFQMSFPVAASLFLVDLALGITARTVPQLNIFVVGLPLKIGVSFVMLILVMGSIFMLIQHVMEMMIETMRNLMQLFAGG